MSAEGLLEFLQRLLTFLAEFEGWLAHAPRREPWWQTLWPLVLSGAISAGIGAAVALWGTARVEHRVLREAHLLEGERQEASEQRQWAELARAELAPFLLRDMSVLWGGPVNTSAYANAEALSLPRHLEIQRAVFEGSHVPYVPDAVARALRVWMAAQESVTSHWKTALDEVRFSVVDSPRLAYSRAALRLAYAGESPDEMSSALNGEGLGNPADLFTFGALLNASPEVTERARSFVAEHDRLMYEAREAAIAVREALLAWNNRARPA